jgi:hypothetical protein
MCTPSQSPKLDQNAVSTLTGHRIAVSTHRIAVSTLTGHRITGPFTGSHGHSQDHRVLHRIAVSFYWDVNSILIPCVNTAGPFDNFIEHFDNFMDLIGTSWHRMAQPWRLMAHPWRTHGAPMAHPWRTHGTSWRTHGAPMAPHGTSWRLMAHPWHLMAHPWRTHGASWHLMAPHGAPMAPHGAPMAHPWHLMAHPWHLMAPHGTPMAHPWRTHGTSWRTHGTSWRLMAHPWRTHGASWHLMAPHGAPMAPHGAPMAPHGAPMAPHGASWHSIKAITKSGLCMKIPTCCGCMHNTNCTMTRCGPGWIKWTPNRGTRGCPNQKSIGNPACSLHATEQLSERMNLLLLSYAVAHDAGGPRRCLADPSGVRRPPVPSGAPPRRHRHARCSQHPWLYYGLCRWVDTPVYRYKKIY